MIIKRKPGRWLIHPFLMIVFIKIKMFIISTLMTMISILIAIVLEGQAKEEERKKLNLYFLSLS